MEIYGYLPPNGIMRSFLPAMSPNATADNEAKARIEVSCILTEVPGNPNKGLYTKERLK
jgi:hypothetical protein